jgi:Lamin Tail Domain
MIQPSKFVFAPGTQIAPGGYLTLLSDTAVGAGIHLGFALDSEGDALYLYTSVAAGGTLVDSVEFGLQIPDFSIGRIGADGKWGLTQPTIGALNVAKALGDPAALRINEWFASGDVRLNDDFVELYNLGTLPVALRGLYLSDDPGARPLRHSFAPLSFTAAQGYAAITADDNAEAGADHAGFELTSGVGRIALFQGGPPLAGDFNDDGIVDTADYVVWRNTNGQIVPGGTGGDANDDGNVDQTDYLLWRADFGNSIDNRAVRTDAAVVYRDVPGLKLIDYVTYMPQTTDYVQGRAPDVSTTLQYFTLPTPGVANATAVNPNTVLSLAILAGLRITEIMYNPLGGTDYEFVELKNVGPTSLSLAGVRIDGGIEFTFPNVSLPAGQFIVVVNNLTAFESRYGAGINVAGEFIGNLNNGGEDLILELAEPYDAAVLRFDFDDNALAGWPTTPDGSGPSLEVINPLGDYRNSANWQASASINGSPGTAGPGSGASLSANSAGDGDGDVFAAIDFAIASLTSAPARPATLDSHRVPHERGADELLILALNEIAQDSDAEAESPAHQNATVSDEAVDDPFAEPLASEFEPKT